MPVIIEGTLCTIRPWQTGDQDALVRHANDRAIWRNVRDAFPYPYTPETARWWLSVSNPDSRNPRNFAIEVAGEAVGGVGLIPGTDVYARSAEVGYWLGREHWGRGLATEALRLLVDYAFDHYGFERLHAGVFGWNPASMRVLEKTGFTREGARRRAVFKDGEFTDEVMYALLRADWQRRNDLTP